MWVMTSFGIFMPSLRPAEHVPVDDPRQLQIRARRKRELEILIREYMPDLDNSDIVYLRFTDYEYRIYCTHQEWARVMSQLALDIDYVKFKDTTDRYKDDKLHGAYLAIWSLLYNRFSTNRAFARPVQPAKKRGKKGKNREEKSLARTLLYEDDDFGGRWKNWYDEVSPIDEEIAHAIASAHKHEYEEDPDGGYRCYCGDPMPVS